MIAYCYASGLIEFGRKVPDGALEITRGPAKTVRNLMIATARHGYGRSAGKLLVPGVPEAPNQSAGLDALLAFRRWLDACEQRRGNHGA